MVTSLSACSSANSADKGEASAEKDNENKTVKIVYVEWVSAIASANVVQTVIEERLGYNVELLPVSAISMWQSVAAGDQDGMLAAWLPSLHEQYYEENKDEVENLGPNLEGALMGIAVPDYVPIDTIEELKKNRKAFDEKIIGIDPGAGVMKKTRKVIEEYNLTNFELVTGSDSTMTKTLANAIKAEKPIIVTAWNPHWKFARWDLKYLKDSKNIYAKDEHISTVVRKGLQEDKPDVYRFLNRFFWEPNDMEQVMLWAREEGTTPKEAAERWVRENKATVDSWVK